MRRAVGGPGVHAHPACWSSSSTPSPPRSALTSSRRPGSRCTGSTSPFARAGHLAGAALSLAVAALRHAAGAGARHAGGRSRWRAAPVLGREALTLLFVLPIALPGIITGIALLRGHQARRHRSRFWTIVAGPRDLLHGHRLQQRGRAPAAPAAHAGGGVDGPRRRRLPDVPLRAAAATWPPRCWPAACWRSHCPSTRSSSPSSPPASRRRCRSGSSTSCSGRATAGHQRGGRDRDRGDLLPILLAYYLTRHEAWRQVNTRNCHAIPSKLVKGKLRRRHEQRAVLNPATGKVHHAGARGRSPGRSTRR